MYGIRIHYYNELNFFLPREHRDMDIAYSFSGRRSVKDLIESMGVPHVEVDLIRVNGTAVEFSYIVNDGDLIEVYPWNGLSAADGVKRLIRSPLADTKFVLDVHLRKLARYLRLAGFDTDYAADRDDSLLADISHSENRILLTCDRQLLMRKIVTRGMIVRSRNPDEQIVEVVARLGLKERINPFTRCIECNGTISSIDINSPDSVAEKSAVPEGVLSWCSEYYICTSCRRIYWRGSHYDRLSVKLESVIRDIEKYPKFPQ